MQIQCKCGAVYNVPESAGGRKVHCKMCDTKFVCPMPPSQSLDTAEQLPATFTGSPGEEKKRNRQVTAARKSREDAILKKHMSVDSMKGERKRERRAKAIEQDRIPNAVVSMTCGVVAMASAVVIGVVLWNLSASPWGDVSVRQNRKLMTILHFTAGKYWFPPLLFLFGLYLFVIGVLTQRRVINLEPGHYMNLLAEFVGRRWF